MDGVTDITDIGSGYECQQQEYQYFFVLKMEVTVMIYMPQFVCLGNTYPTEKPYVYVRH